MNDGPTSARSQRIGSLVVFAALVWTARAHGGPAEQRPMRVVVRAQTAEELALVKRVRGQVAGLEVELSVAGVAPWEGAMREQLAAADQLARTHSASIVLWFDFERDSVRVFISNATSGRLFVQKLVDEGSDKRARSVTLESAALVARGALRALAEGGDFGVSRETLLPAEPAEPAVPAPPPPEVQPRPAPPTPPSRVKRNPPVTHHTEARPWLSGAYRAAGGGLSQYFEHGVMLEGGVAFQPWQIGIGVWYVPTVSASLSPTTVSVTRWTLPVSMAFWLLRSRTWQVGLGVEGGATFVHRHTEVEPRVNDVEATPDRVLMIPWLGADLRSRWQLPWAEHWMVGVRAGVGGSPIPASLGYESSESSSGSEEETVQQVYRTRHQYSGMQPFVQLAVEYVHP